MRINENEFQRTLETIITELVVAEIVNVNRKLEEILHNQRRIMATLEERFNAVNTKLDEASAEILAEIEKLKNESLTPAGEAALASLEAKANALADIGDPLTPPNP